MLTFSERDLLIGSVTQPLMNGKLTAACLLFIKYGIGATIGFGLP